MSDTYRPLPTLLVLATLGAVGLTRHSLPLEAQVHEREHL